MKSKSMRTKIWFNNYVSQHTNKWFEIKDDIMLLL